MRETRQSGSEGGGAELNRSLLPLSGRTRRKARSMELPLRGRCWPCSFRATQRSYVVVRLQV